MWGYGFTFYVDLLGRSVNFSCIFYEYMKSGESSYWTCGTIPLELGLTCSFNFFLIIDGLKK